MPATKKKPAKPAKTPSKKGPTYLKLLRDSLQGVNLGDLQRDKSRELQQMANQTGNYVAGCIAAEEGVPVGMMIRALARFQAAKALANIGHDNLESDRVVKEALQEVCDHLQETRQAINTILHSLGGDVAVATNATQRSAEEGFDITGNG